MQDTTYVHPLNWTTTQRRIGVCQLPVGCWMRLISFILVFVLSDLAVVTFISDVLICDYADTAPLLAEWRKVRASANAYQ